MRPTVTVLVIAATLAVSGAAVAQQPPGSGPDRDQSSPAMQAMHEAHKQQRIADLRTVLRLRPDQEAALTALLKSDDDRPGRPDRPMGPPPLKTTPQQLDAMEQRAAEHAAMGKRRADTVRAFYAALSPEQRQVFDALMRLKDGDRGGHGHGRMGGPGMMGRGPGPGMDGAPR